MNFTSNLRCRLLLSLLVIAVQTSSGKDLSPALEAPVKLHQSAVNKTPAMAAQPTRRPVPTPSTPSAKYPQYQLGPKQRNESALGDATNPRLRFLLNLPDGLALLEATITIDGQPFRMPRQQRIERTLKDLAENKVDVTPAIPVQAADPKAVPVQAVADPTGVPATSTSIVERLRHTMKLTEKSPSQEEVHWILCNWVDGPTLLQLNDHFQRFRADQRPELIVLDRNRDGSISAEEIALSAQSLQECDLNRDGIVMFTEIAAAANDPRLVAANKDPGSLLTLLPERTSAAIPYPKAAASTQSNNANEEPSDTRSRFDANGDGEVDADELRALQQATPDVVLSIAFDTAKPERSRIAVVSAAKEFEQSLDQATIDTAGITMMFKRTPVIFSAAQMASGDQISIGAVNDGYPLLPKLDLNDDGRLTIRELRTIPATLITFDKNHDGMLTPEETQSPIRVCVGLGATVHVELAGIRTQRNKDTSVPSEGPEWFTRMDRNKDRDLTRAEFPGTDEQFSALDADGDQLISVDEATVFEKNNQNADNEASRSVSNPESTKTDPDSKNAPVSKEEKQP